jgi:LCP family protein required for cell wall assembly
MHKKRHRFLRFVITVTALVLVVFFLTLALCFRAAGRVQSMPENNLTNQYISKKELRSSSRVENILLLGMDRTAENDSTRSDTILLCSIDRKNNMLKLTSFLRDSWVTIPGHGENKLNAACAIGGVQLVLDTIEYNFKIRIDHYFMADFAGFQTIIDAVGGVDVPVTEAEINYLCKETRLATQIGRTGMREQMDENGAVHFYGSQALIYCRIRKLDNDFMRTYRQRKVLDNILEKLDNMRKTKFIGVAKKTLPLIETDMTQNQLAAFAMRSIPALRYAREQKQVPFTNTWTNATKSGMDVLTFSIEKNAEFLQAYIY